MARNQSLTQEEFLERAYNIYGTTYDYSETIYINKRNKVIIKCMKHGNFEQYPSNHLAGSGCEKCSREKKLSKGKKLRKFNFPVLKAGSKLTQEECIERFKIVHGDKFDYSLVKYVKNDVEVLIICKEHGPFYQKPSIHWGGSDCPRCNNYTLTQEECINRFIEKHGNKYDYSLVEYIKNDFPVTIICKEHGPFEKLPIHHWNGSGCPECSKINTSKIEIMNRLNDINPYQHSFELVNYVSMHKKVTIICKKHGPFERTLANYFTNYLCPKCNPQKSKYELELEEFLKLYNIDIQLNTRKIISPLELDLYLPDYKLGIEFNGLIFHSYGFSKFKMFNNYEKRFENKHSKKLELMKNINLNLFQIKESDWSSKKDIIKSILLSKLGKNNRIFARKLKVVNLTEYKDFVINFLNINHLDGYNTFDICYGLSNDKNEIFSIVTFKKRLIREDFWDIVQFCSILNCTIIGGISKILKVFENIHKPKEIFGKVNRDLSDGKIFEILNFNKICNTQPNIFWVKEKTLEIYSDEFFNINILSKINHNFKNNLSQDENIFNNGFRKYLDSGNILFHKKLKELK